MGDVVGFVGGGVGGCHRQRVRVVTCSADGGKRDGDGRWKRIAAAVVAGVSLMGLPGPADAIRGAGRSMFKMTDSAAEFVLPSEKAEIGRERKKAEGNGAFKKAISIGISATPYVVGGGAVIGGGYYAMRRVQQSQVKRFQRDLQGMSELFGDRDTSPLPRQQKKQVDTAKMARDILEKSKTKYKFRERTPARDRSDQIQLDLFQDQSKKDESWTPPADDPPVPVAETSTVKDSETSAASNDLEKATLAFVNGSGDVAAVKASAQEMNLSEVEATERVGAFGSSLASKAVDSVVAKLRMVMGGDLSTAPPIEEVKSLAGIAGKIRQLASEAFGKEVKATYNGTMLNKEMSEQIYKVYTMSLMMQGVSQDSDAVKQLEDLQQLLDIPPEWARATYDETVKEVMQAAMNEAELNPQAKEMMEKLRQTVDDTVGGAGGGDTNEDVMQMIYALQLLMIEQGISDEDAKEMRKMVKDMGIDAKELLRNAETLVRGIGPEARPLVDALTKLLVVDDVVTEVSAKTVQDQTPLPGSG